MNYQVITYGKFRIWLSCSNWIPLGSKEEPSLEVFGGMLLAGYVISEVAPGDTIGAGECCSGILLSLLAAGGLASKLGSKSNKKA